MGCTATVRACGPDAAALPADRGRGPRRGGPRRPADEPLPAGQPALAPQPRGGERAGRRGAGAPRVPRRVPALEPRVGRGLRRHRGAADEGVGLLPRRGPRARRGRARRRRSQVVGYRHVRRWTARPAPSASTAPASSSTSAASARATPSTASSICCGAGASRRPSSTSAAAASTAWARRPGATAWEVGIQDPTAPGEDRPHRVAARPGALASPAATRRFFEKDGVTYAHIMDPRTGRPVQGVLSVAVLSDERHRRRRPRQRALRPGPRPAPASSSSATAPTEALFFLPRPGGGWRLVRVGG